MSRKRFKKKTKSVKDVCTISIVKNERPSIKYMSEKINKQIQKTSNIFQVNQLKKVRF